MNTQHDRTDFLNIGPSEQRAKGPKDGGTKRKTEQRDGRTKGWMDKRMDGRRSSSSIFQRVSDSEIKEVAPEEVACHAAVKEEEAQRPGGR